MCLIVFAWCAHPGHPFILAANRDEFHRRPASPLQWWPDRPQIAAGRDLQAGGTWLAASRSGRFATVANYRETLAAQPGERSRGALVTDFVTGSLGPLAFAASIDGERYAGFSLLTATPEAVAYASNRSDAPRLLASGVYGLSNAALDTPWPKVVKSRQRLRALVDQDAVTFATLFDLLADREPAGAADASDQDLPPEMARAVSAPFVVTPEYGTRCSTVFLLGVGGEAELSERRFDATGRMIGNTSVKFRLH
ncbi:MAG: NRDE family protein [Steroidobacteraceae bacterium]